MKQEIFTSQYIGQIIQMYNEGKKIPKIWYREIEGLRTSGILFHYTQWEILEYAKCYNNPIYFFEEYCRIRNNKIHLRDYQKVIIHKFSENKFTINACSTGISTVIILLMLHKALFSTDSTSVLINNKLCECAEKIDKLKDIYVSLPFFLKQGIKSWNKLNIDFENGSRIIGKSSTNLTMGYNVNNFFLDNFAHFKNPERLINVVYPSISAIKGARLMISSTPKGKNIFTELLENAERKMWAKKQIED
jgi:hypothetical protein